MANHALVGAAASAPSLHHRRKDEENSGVYRRQNQDQSHHHQSGRDNDPTQATGARRGAARTRVAESAVRIRVLHDRVLPGPYGCHTSPATRRGSVRG